MGFWHSKTLRKPEQSVPEKPKNPDPHEVTITRLRNTLNHDWETFLLNNILLSVQFFDNYEREVGNLRVRPVSNKDTERNSGLAEHQRYCLSPDQLYEAVGRWVRFRPQHGERSHTYELLHAPRLFITPENVEVLENIDTEQYSTVTNATSYYFSLEKTKKPGYKKIRVEESMLPHKRRTTYETIEDDEGVYEHIASDNTEQSDRDKISKERTHEQDIIAHSSTCPEIPELTTIQSQPSITADVPSTSSKHKKKFGPQTEQSDPMKYINFTPTERRLSGIRKAANFSEYEDARQEPKFNSRSALKPAFSLPSLAISDNVDSRKTTSSPKHSDSSGYKSEGGSPSRHNSSPPRSHSSDSDYGYTTITEFATPRPLDQHRLGHVPSNTAQIPMECFFKLDVPVYEEDDGITSKGRKKLFETRHYLNSTVYMRSFADIFQEKLATPLGFASGLESATLQGTRIYCDIVQNGHDSKPVKIRNEIIPALFSTAWPQKEAFKWKSRKRNRVHDSRPNVAYTWPNQSMLEQVLRLGCHLLPLGYTPTRKSNNERHLEWQLAFPKAERYLETTLTHPQVRCLLFCLALYKSYLEPRDVQLGLSFMHIRTLLFWQCEKKYAEWPEDRPGETLKKFLKIIYEKLQLEELEDYFIPERNLFESIPNTYLYRDQKKLKHIREKLVMHVLLAVRNLRYVGSSFYPTLDCKKLYHIITTDNLETLQIQSKGVIPKPIQRQTEQDDEDDLYDDSDRDSDNSNIDLWKTVNKKDPMKKWKQDRWTQIEIKKAVEKQAKKQSSKPRRPSIDSINLEVELNRSAEVLRKKALLEFFIPHFIEIAKKSNSFRATRQARFYLQHADNLIKQLIECGYGEKSAKHYSHEIEVIRLAMGRDSSGPSSEITTNHVQNPSTKLDRGVPPLIPQNSRPNLFRKKVELPITVPASEQTTKKKPMALKVSSSLANKTVEPTHKTKDNLNSETQTEKGTETQKNQHSLPPSPGIKIDVSHSPPLSPTVVLTEVVTAESTDF